jgi:hypothetical protein
VRRFRFGVSGAVEIVRPRRHVAWVRGPSTSLLEDHMRWLGIAGIALFVAGLALPSVGLILDRNYGKASFALCSAGIAAVGATFLARGIRRRSDSSDDSGGFADSCTDFDHHHSHGHDGGHGGDGGDGGH